MQGLKSAILAIFQNGLGLLGPVSEALLLSLIAQHISPFLILKKTISWYEAKKWNLNKIEL